MVTGERQTSVVSADDSTELINDEVFIIPYNSHRTFIALAYSMDGIGRIINSIKIKEEFSQTPIFYSAIGQGIWLIRGERITAYTLENPFKTGSDSDAVYVATAFLENGILLAQYLPPFKSTSHHRHGREIFSNTGDLLMWKNEKEVMPVTGKITLQQQEAHIEFTANKPAFTFIYRPGKTLDHEDLPKPSMEFLLEQAIEAKLVSADVLDEYRKLQAA